MYILHLPEKLKRFVQYDWELLFSILSFQIDLTAKRPVHLLMGGGHVKESNTISLVYLATCRS